MSYDNLSVLTDAHARELHRLYQLEWWTKGRTIDDVRTMLAASRYVYGVSESASGKLVAFARVLSDDIFKALIFDVIVDPAHRGHGLGSRLMECILNDERLARVHHFELYCLAELEPYYERLGFATDVGGVRLMRREAR